MRFSKCLRQLCQPEVAQLTETQEKLALEANEHLDATLGESDTAQSGWRKKTEPGRSNAVSDLFQRRRRSPKHVAATARTRPTDCPEHTCCVTVLSNTTKPNWGEHPDEWRDKLNECTSCLPGAAFEMVHARSRAGKCRPKHKPVMIRCRALDHNGWQASPTATNKLCVKYGVVDHLFFPQRKDGSKVYNWFASGLSKRGKYVEKHAIARCELVKYIACRNGQCAVRKDVKCLEICNWILGRDVGHGKLFDRRSCDKKLCAKPYGGIACREVAMTA